VAAPSGDLLTPTLTGHRPRERTDRLPWRLSSLLYPSILGGPIAAVVVAVLNGRRLRADRESLWSIAIAGFLATAAAVALAVLVESDETRILVSVCGLAVYGVAYRLERSPDRVYTTFSPREDPDDDYEPFFAPAFAAIVLGLGVLALLVYLFGGPALGGTAALDDPEIWALRGWALVDLDRCPEAAQVARDALGSWPDDVVFLRLLAVAEALCDRLAEAEQAVLAALAIEPDSPQLLCTYADTLMRGGQLRKAGSVLDLATRADPDDVLVLRMRLNLAYLEGDDREARGYAEELLGRNADDYQGQVMLGGLDLEKLRLDTAEQRFGSAVRTDPSGSAGVVGARTVSILRSPLYWPLLPFERFGPGPTWVAAVALIFGLRAAGADTASTVAALVWIALCVYSWVAAPILQRRMKAENW
jgi:tetratricopeptide (TPR) repeat protein